MTTPETKFAVDLSNDGMSLWHRDKTRAWKLVGKVALTAENFSDDIEKLKSGLTPNSGGKYISQVRIPSSEVFTSDIDLNGAKGDEIASIVNKFLARNTPYAVDDLIFDLSNKPDQAVAYIAAIAKETIAEAREFITGYGFEAAYYTTKLSKGDFPQNPRFYDLDDLVVGEKETPVVAPPVKSAAISVPPPPAKVKKEPQDKKPVVAMKKADLSGFETIRKKSDTAPDKSTLTAKPPTPITPPRRISIEMPTTIKPAPLAPTPIEKAAPKKAAQVITPIKMPQSKTIKTDMRGMFKPRYILALIAIILLGLMYWLYSFLIEGKEEITRLQQISDTPPLIIATPQSMVKKTSQDDAPSLKGKLATAPTQGPDISTPLGLSLPDPLKTDEDTMQFATAKNPTKQPEPTIDTALADQEQSETPQEPTVATLAIEPSEPEAAEVVTDEVAVVAQLVPTKDGTPGPEGITLFLGQPEFQPPLREQLKISQDPLKDILPKMRSKEFEEINKTESLPEPDTQVTSEGITDIAEAPTPETEAEAADQPTENEAAPDLLALADPTLKSKLPKPRPSTIEQTAKELQNSLLARADPALASSKPKRRPANLSVPFVRIDPADIEIAIKQAVAETARPRARPRSLSQTVKRAKANVQTASLTPSTAAGTSKAGTSSPVNIQKEATEKSRFNKRRISLVGVYGTPAKRRALVRMPSGRYVKVKQGQKFSGWKVSAIGESTVRITKGSRNQVLRMPK